MENIKYYIRTIGELLSVIIWIMLIIPIGILITLVNDILISKNKIVRIIKKHK